MDKIFASNIRYIKLGEQGKWEKSSLEGPEPVIRLGYDSPYHANCLAGDWGTVLGYWKGRRSDAGAATRDVNQIRDFYELAEDTLWITFYNRLLYWCFVKTEVVRLEDTSRIRQCKDKWHCTDITGKPLAIQNIDED